MKYVSTLLQQHFKIATMCRLIVSYSCTVLVVRLPFSIELRLSLDLI